MSNGNGNGGGFTFTPAARIKAKGRIALTGPAGSGKTLGALYIAAGLAPDGRTAVIDTEHQSAALYAGKPGVPAYDVCVLAPPFHPDRYREAIAAAEGAGYDVIIIDSLSHAWAGAGGVLEQKDVIATGKGENSYTAWNKAGKMQNTLTDAVLRSPAHVIVTMRSKQEYVLEANDRGKQTPRKVGMAPVQREGVEYEYGIVLDISIDHTATSSKDRSGLFDGQFFRIDGKVGEAIRAWLDSGVSEAPAAPAPLAAPAAPAPAATSTRACRPAEFAELQAALKVAKPADVPAYLSGIVGRPVTSATITTEEAKAAAKAIREEIRAEAASVGASVGGVS